MKIRFLLFTGVAVAIAIAQLHAAVPLMTSYQGRVKVAGANFSGTGQFKFALIAKPGGASLWSNDGTSVGGSEPAAAVSLPVTDGLFTVLLGDASLANMRPLTADIFAANADVALRVWFSDGVNGSLRLAPDTILGSAPYALSASVASNSITGAHLSPGSIDATKLASANAPAAGRVLTYDGAEFNWADPATAGSVWSVNGTNAYYIGGNVGIGTASPAHRLSLSGGPRWTDNGWTGALDFESGAALGWSANASGQRFGMGHTGAGFFMFRTDNDPGTTGSLVTYDFAINDAGNVGIGTWIPEAKLHVAGDLRYDGRLTKLDVADAFVATVRAGDFLLGHSARRGEPGRALVDFYPALHLNFGDWPTTIIGGNVGIGTVAPDAKLHVESAGVNAVVHGKATDANTGVFGESTSTAAGTAAVYGKNLSGVAIAAEGHATQNRDKGGFVKAMLYVGADGTIIRGYNSFLTGNAATTPPCGCVVVHAGSSSPYTIDFNFQVGDRFVSVTPGHSGVARAVATVQYGSIVAGFGNRIYVSTYVEGITDDQRAPADFTVIVY